MSTASDQKLPSESSAIATMRWEPFRRMREAISARPECGPSQKLAISRTGFFSVSDEFLVPVCRIHHRELHRSGNEAAWWRKFNIDPIPIALRLWEQTRTDGGQSDPKLWKNARLDEGRTDSKPASQAAAADGSSETPA